MKVIVIGYGRMGSQVVKKVDTQAHEVVVIDKERAVFNRPDAPRGARFIVGNALDEDLLREAGADSADVLTALTRDENTNLMIAQMARVVFNLPRVVAVVYDPEREVYFHEAGIETLSMTVVGADLLAAQLAGASGEPGATLALGRLPAPSSVRVPLRPLEAQDDSLYIIVVGGGLVGFYLARTLLRSGHEITIIEKETATYNLVSQQIDCPVLVGDGSSMAVLERVGASRANLLCAVTNHDQDNLIACQVAKFRFGVSKTIARVKNPKNESVMRRLGVDATVSSTSVIASVIENELPTIRVRKLAGLGSRGAGIIEYHLAPISPAVGKYAREVVLPSNSSVISILRRGEALTSLDSTVLEGDDAVVALVEQSQESAVRKILLG